MNDDDIMRALVYFTGQEKAWKGTSKAEHYTCACAALNFTISSTNALARFGFKRIDKEYSKVVYQDGHNRGFIDGFNECERREKKNENL